MDDAQRVDRACTWLAECAVSECAYSGEPCIEMVKARCVEDGAWALQHGEGPTLVDHLCAHTMCDESLTLRAEHYAIFVSRCIEGAPEATCSDGNHDEWCGNNERACCEQGCGQEPEIICGRECDEADENCRYETHGNACLAECANHQIVTVSNHHAGGEGACQDGPGNECGGGLECLPTMLGCLEASVCVGSCAGNDIDCQEDCLERAGGLSQRAAEALYLCNRNFECNGEQACIAANCAMEFAACGEARGGYTCVSGLDCLILAEDEEARAACVEEVAPWERARFDATVECIRENECNGFFEGEFGCVQNRCLNEARACINEGAQCEGACADGRCGARCENHNRNARCGDNPEEHCAAACRQLARCAEGPVCPELEDGAEMEAVCLAACEVGEFTEILCTRQRCDQTVEVATHPDSPWHIDALQPFCQIEH